MSGGYKVNNLIESFNTPDESPEPQVRRCLVLLLDMNIRDASTTAAKSRLRPILMTTLTTVLGMLPMAVGTGEGSEMWRSLGVTVCWGLSISTLVTLVLIPTVYCAFANRQERRKNK
mgnify:CR=1 FL=1